MSDEGRKYCGMILQDKVLHLFDDDLRMREMLSAIGRDWERISWIDGIVFHDADAETPGAQASPADEAGTSPAPSQ